MARTLLRLVVGDAEQSDGPTDGDGRALTTLTALGPDTSVMDRYGRETGPPPDDAA
jgi:hypothetical protein